MSYSPETVAHALHDVFFGVVAATPSHPHAPLLHHHDDPALSLPLQHWPRPPCLGCQLSLCASPGLVRPRAAPCSFPVRNRAVRSFRLAHGITTVRPAVCSCVGACSRMSVAPARCVSFVALTLITTVTVDTCGRSLTGTVNCTLVNV